MRTVEARSRRGRGLPGALGAVLLLSSASTAAPPPPPSEPPVLRVLTLNVWHGLVGEKGGWRLAGEEPERKRRRVAAQIEEIRRLAPDVLLLQELNPAPREAKRYARALGYDQIHKVANCGLHLGPLKIPVNINEGLAILARPELGLGKAGSQRLSGNALCADGVGFQTRESRFALFGRITMAGRLVLVATTHLSNPPWAPPGFEAEIESLVGKGVLTAAQRDEVLGILERRRARNLAETRRLLAELERRQRRLSSGAEPLPAVLGGDLNAEPGTPSIAAVTGAGLASAASGPEFSTWDPVTHRENHRIGAQTAPPLPTFGVAELEALLAPRATTPRQIDHVFVSENLEVVSARRVLDRAHGGLLPSDHYGLLVTLRLGGPPPPDP